MLCLISFAILDGFLPHSATFSLNWVKIDLGR